MKLVVNRVPEVLPDPAPQTDDPFAAFTSESEPKPTPPERAGELSHWWRNWRLRAPSSPAISMPRMPLAGRVVRRIAVVVVSVAILAAAGFVGVNQVRARWLAVPVTGLLTVSSSPAGAQVLIDGAVRGVTPLTVNVPVGAHTMTVRSGAVSKDFSITAKKGVELVQNIELAAPAPTMGNLAVTSEPSGLKISVDGVPRGNTPARIDQLSAGVHTVSVSGKSGTTEREVLVAAGGTATLSLSLAPATTGAGIGSVSISSPIEVQLFEGDTLIGSSQSARVYLPAGSHSLTAVNESLGFRRSFVVDVKGSEVERVSMPIPNGALSVNAQPWAEVFVDGRSLGETPIGNYALPIGSHELVLKHPQFGERKQTVVIGVGRTARIGVDLRK